MAGAFDSDRQIALKFSQGTENAPRDLIADAKGARGISSHI